MPKMKEKLKYSFVYFHLLFCAAFTMEIPKDGLNIFADCMVLEEDGKREENFSHLEEIAKESWESYKAYNPNFRHNFSGEKESTLHLEESIVQYFVECLKSRRNLRKEGCIPLLLKNRDNHYIVADVLSTFFTEVNFIKNKGEYKSVLKEKQAFVREILGEDAPLENEGKFIKETKDYSLIKEKNSYDKLCMFSYKHIEGGYSRIAYYIHLLPDFLIEHMLIDFTINHFDKSKSTYEGENLRQTLFDFSSLFHLIINKSSIFSEGMGQHPAGFGNFVGGETKSRFLMKNDHQPPKGDIVFLGSGLCDFYKELKEEEYEKIILNDLNPLFPLLSLYKINVPIEKLDRFKIVGGSAVNISLSPNSVSKVYAGYLLKYLKEKKVRFLFQNISYALQEGGRFYIDEISYNSMKEAQEKARKKNSSRFDYGQNIKSSLSIDELVRIAKLKFVYAYNGDLRAHVLRENLNPRIAQYLPERGQVLSYNLVLQK